MLWRMREDGGKEEQGGGRIGRSSSHYWLSVAKMEKTPHQGASQKRQFAGPPASEDSSRPRKWTAIYMFMRITSTLNPTTPSTTTTRSPSNLTYTHSCWIPKQGSLPALHQGSELFIAGPLQRVSGSAGWNDIYGAPWARVGRTEGETELGVRWEGRAGGLKTHVCVYTVLKGKRWLMAKSNGRLGWTRNEERVEHKDKGIITDEGNETGGQGWNNEELWVSMEETKFKRFTTLNSTFHTVVFSLPFPVQYEGKSNSWRRVWVTHFNTLLTINN